MRYLFLLLSFITTILIASPRIAQAEFCDGSNGICEGIDENGDGQDDSSAWYPCMIDSPGNNIGSNEDDFCYADMCGGVVPECPQDTESKYDAYLETNSASYGKVSFQ